jgi:hypothetical protein
MIKKREIDLPLHPGKAPAWLFKRMKTLSGLIIEAIYYELGENDVLSKLSNPLWFQSFGCFLGFDWHSSGLTTVLTGAIKEGIKQRGIPVFIAGGKGKTSLKTPHQIEEICEKQGMNSDHFIRASRLSAKIDNTLVQDGYNLYHHVFIFTKKGRWVVIQQGMNEKKGWARRYHWFSEDITNLFIEPHTGIITSRKGFTLNLVSKKVKNTQNKITEISRENPDKIIKEIKLLKRIKMPERHEILLKDIKSENLRKVLTETYERKPENFEGLLLIKGTGPKTMRALALLSNLLYSSPLSFEDPAKYSFAHGGKDGYPYPVDKRNYDKTIQIMEKALKRAKLGNREYFKMLKKMEEVFI